MLRAFNPNFTVALSELEQIKLHARSFLVRFAELPIIIDDNWHITTPPAKAECGFHYEMSWAVIGDSVDVIVRCTTLCTGLVNKSYCKAIDQLAIDNAHIFAYYCQMARFPSPGLFCKHYCASDYEFI